MKINAVCCTPESLRCDLVPDVVFASQAPLAPESLDELFRYAAKNLPANNLLGTDAGLWAGLKVESVQAMENFASEITYLVGESKKGGKGLDSADLISYHGELVTKMKVAPPNLPTHSPTMAPLCL